MNNLSAYLATTVPLVMEEIQARGGVAEDDIRQAQEYGDILAEKGDVLLFGYANGKTPKGKPSPQDLAVQLAHAVAVLALICPGGITVFEQHFEKEIEP